MMPWILSGLQYIQKGCGFKLVVTMPNNEIYEFKNTI